MKSLDLIKDLSRVGATINLDGENLRVRAPKGVLTEARRDMLRSHKPELVRILSTYPCVSCGRFSFPEPSTLCYWCAHPPERAA